MKRVVVVVVVAVGKTRSWRPVGTAPPDGPIAAVAAGPWAPDPDAASMAGQCWTVGPDAVRTAANTVAI